MSIGTLYRSGSQAYSGFRFSYYRARYYDPSTGRFLSEDPIGFDGGVNLYAYVENHPTDFVDPFGYKGGVTVAQVKGDIRTAIQLLKNPNCLQFVLDTLQKVQSYERQKNPFLIQGWTVSIQTFVNTMQNAQITISNSHPNYAAHAGTIGFYIDQGYYDGPLTMIHETFHILQPWMPDDMDMADALNRPYKKDPRNPQNTMSNASRAWDCLLVEKCKVGGK